MKGYPRSIVLKDGKEVTIRLMNKDDLEKMHAFLSGLPREDRLYLKEDVTRREVVARWVRELNYRRVLPIVAEYKGRIVGNGSLHMNPHGWMRHVGEVRCAIGRDFQRKGLGTSLLMCLVEEGMKRGLDKLVAHVVENQMGAIHAFSRAGFKEEALLKDHILDLNDKKKNLLVLTNDITEIWHDLEEIIVGTDWTHLRIG